MLLTLFILESHCFQPSPYFCGQYMATKQKQKIIALDKPIITTIMGKRRHQDKKTHCVLIELYRV